MSKRRPGMKFDLFSIGSWTLFDHILRIKSFPEDGDTIPIDMPTQQIDRIHFGDCSANVAATAAKLGLKSGLGMVVGSDFVTSGYRDHLLEMQVDLSGTQVHADQQSGHSYNIFDTAGRSFCLSNLELAKNQDHWTPPLDQVRQAQCVVINEMFSPYTLAAAEAGKEAGAIVIINGMVGTAGDLLQPFLSAAEMLFMSRREGDALLQLLGLREFSQLIDFGISRVVITQGGEGSHWIGSDGEHQQEIIPAAKLVDATGAGDSFVAGAVYGRLNGWPVAETARFAAALSSFVVEAWGCQTNLPTVSKVLERANGSLEGSHLHASH